VSSALDKWDSVEAPDKSSLERWDAAPSKASAVAKPAANDEKPGKVMSALAGAGEATGRGVLAVQQIIGKGATALGSAVDSDTLKKAGDWLNADAVAGAKKLTAENAPYQEANPKSNLGGEIVGMVASPVNKLVPGGGAATTLVGATAKGAVQGAALNALTSPVTDDKPFLWEKIKQGGLGAVGGALGGAVGHGISKALDKAAELFQRAGNRVATGNVDSAAQNIVGKALDDMGVPAVAVKADRPDLFAGLHEQVKDALAAGKKVDPQALTRLARAQTLPVPVPMLKGQITREPMQFAMEQNLRGIHGVGEPIKDTLTAQNKALIANLDVMGAKDAADVVSAGKVAIDTLKAADKAASKSVSDAYGAFKAATGKDLDVPLHGLSQDYAATLKEFGDAIPSSIRNKFEALGLESGTVKKVFSIEAAEGLIKSINKNYDPANRVQARALDELRQGVQKAISEGAGSSVEGGAAASLAKAARTAAKERFGLIDQTPALKAAIHGEQPDKFIQKFILNGNAAEVKSMMDTLGKADPQAAEQLQNSVMGFIKNRVTNLNQDGSFSQAQLKQFVADPNMSARLTKVLGPEKMSLLKQLNATAEDAIYAPHGSAVNRSNTASAGANLVKSAIQGGSLNSLLDVAKNIPGLATAASKGQEAVQSSRAAKLIDQAVNPSLKQSGVVSLGDVVNARLRPDQLGTRAGTAYVEEKNRRRAQR
jgi:hypothetical protein